MRKDGLGNLYDRLSPDERFRLLVEALVHEDEDEVVRLARTCPRERRTSVESAYTDRIRISAQMTMSVCLFLAPRLAKLETLKALREGFRYVLDACIVGADLAFLTGDEVGAQRSWMAAGKTEKPPGWEADGEKPILEEELRGMIANFLKKVNEEFLGRLEE